MDESENYCFWYVQVLCRQTKIVFRNTPSQSLLTIEVLSISLKGLAIKEDIFTNTCS